MSEAIGPQLHFDPVLIWVYFLLPMWTSGKPMSISEFPYNHSSVGIQLSALLGKLVSWNTIDGSIYSVVDTWSYLKITYYDHYSHINF